MASWQHLQNPLLCLRTLAASLRQSPRSIALGVVVSLATGLVVVVLLAQHKPSWYRPAVLDEAGLERARLDATTAWDDVSGRMVVGRSFEVTLTEQEINAWIAALAHDRPELLTSLPPEFQSPAVGFVNGELRVGAFCESGGWRAILSANLAPGTSADRRYCTLDFLGASLGSLPVSKALIERIAGPLLSETLEATNRRDARPSPTDGNRAAQWVEEGFRIENHFVWPNGDRPFRIESIKAGDGTLRVRLHPL